MVNLVGPPDRTATGVHQGETDGVGLLRDQDKQHPVGEDVVATELDTVLVNAAVDHRKGEMPIVELFQRGLSSADPLFHEVERVGHFDTRHMTHARAGA